MIRTTRLIQPADIARIRGMLRGPVVDQLMAEVERLWAIEERATVFTFGGKPHWDRVLRTDYPVTVEACVQRDENVTWAVRQLGACLSSDGDWEIEPIPSSRDAEFLARCRFDRGTAFRLAAEASGDIKKGRMIKKGDVIVDDRGQVWRLMTDCPHILVEADLIIAVNAHPEASEVHIPGVKVVLEKVL